MRLVIDAGNSTIAAALADDGHLLATDRRPIAEATDPERLATALSAALGAQVLETSAVEAVVLASVVPAATAAVTAFAAHRGLDLIVAGPDTIPIAVRLRHPAEVGPDRLVNAFAAARLHGVPAVVVDVGTATTWECVDAAGAFVGGAIAPGLRLGLDALAERTALLPRVSVDLPASAIGRDTVSAIRSGTVLGHAELVTGLTRRIVTELAERCGVAPEAVHTVLTGGLSATEWSEAPDGFETVDPDLTLRGLALLPVVSPAIAR
ncbi:MAG TPA: type III pantothenate kinase [Candidatus Limnocylindrales bacterium]|nr:type III pantothenate kinase [Candidatus Limnocylindrales bacterium]